MNSKEDKIDFNKSVDSLVIVSRMNLALVTEKSGKTMEDTKISVRYHFSIHKTCVDLVEWKWKKKAGLSEVQRVLELEVKWVPRPIKWPIWVVVSDFFEMNRDEDHIKDEAKRAKKPILL